MSFKLDIEQTELSEQEISELREMRRRCARRILLSTSLAASGHPGGSLSSLDMLLVAYGIIKHDPKQPHWQGRDRFVESIGHISPGVYSVLAEYGYFSEDDFLSGFRRTGSGFPGHVESIAPGVEWDTGNLGPGLSAASTKKARLLRPFDSLINISSITLPFSWTETTSRSAATQKTSCRNPSVNCMKPLVGM